MRLTHNKPKWLLTMRSRVCEFGEKAEPLDGMPPLKYEDCFVRVSAYFGWNTFTCKYSLLCRKCVEAEKYPWVHCTIILPISSESVSVRPWRKRHCQICKQECVISGRDDD